MALEWHEIGLPFWIDEVGSAGVGVVEVVVVVGNDKLNTFDKRLRRESW